jgi:hypothetical protein
MRDIYSKDVASSIYFGVLPRRHSILRYLYSSSPATLPKYFVNAPAPESDNGMNMISIELLAE